MQPDSRAMEILPTGPLFANSRDQDRVQTRIRLLAFCVLLLSTWDIYVASVRPLDIMALCVMTGLMATAKVSDLGVGFQKIPPIEMGAFCLAIILLHIYNIIGLFANDGAAAINLGLAACFYIFILFYFISIRSEDLAKVVDFVLVVQSTFLLFQFAYFLNTGEIFQFYSFLGLEARLESAIVRQAGLYLEPAHFCLAIAMLLSIRFKATGKIGHAGTLALISILPSMSVWGLGALILFFALAKPFLFLCFLAFAIPLSASIYTMASDLELEFVTYIVNDRLGRLDQDGSAQERFGGYGNMFTSLSDGVQGWLGEGFNNSYHEYGTNGISFLFNAIGLVGLVVFGLLCISLNRSRSDLRHYLPLLLILSGAPIVTNFMWWAWLGLWLSARRSSQA